MSETPTPQSGVERTTQSDITRMSDEEKRIRIAELCGWNLIERTRNKKVCRQYWAPDQSGICTVWPDNSLGGHLFPNYLYDLNAMHEAERVLKGEEVYRYSNALQQVMGLYGGKGSALRLDNWEWHATAKQRAEAFLRTHNGSTNPKRSSSTASGVSEQ